MILVDKIIYYLNSGNERSILAKRNIVGSFFNKAIAIIISLLLVPVTIDYLNPEQYGIWLTISSIVAWISYFDVGLVHGFKNRFAEAKAKGNFLLARQYVSTAYAVMAIIFSCIIIIVEIVNPYINWSSFLNVSDSYNSVLTSVCAILFLFMGIHLILGVISALLTADQHSAYASAIGTIGQGCALLCIYLLTQISNKSMVYICFALSGIPCVILLFATIWLFMRQYRQYTPSLQYLRLNLIKNIIGLGSKFFIIQLSMLLIFQVTNVILLRVLGPDAVTLYNVSYKYFSIIQMGFTIILSPFWAAYTDAYTQGDFEWMSKMYKKIMLTFYKAILLSILMLIVSPIVFRLWLPDKVHISWTLSIAMWLYVAALTYSNIFMILINGTGKVFIQMIIYVSFALITIPISYLSCQQFGIQGVLAVLTLVYSIQALVARIQLNKLITNNAQGIWNK